MCSSDLVLSMPSRARFRFDNYIVHDETDEPVCHGYTVHVVVDARGRAIRPPDWMTELTKAERDTTE